MEKFGVSKTVNQKYFTKMMKVKQGWFTKGLLMSVLVSGALINNSAEVNANEWKANEVAEIAQRIDVAEKSLTMIEGDTVWNLGLALNIKNPMSLLYENNYGAGEQYQLDIGTKIYFNGNHVAIMSEEGDIIGGGVVDKVDENQTVAYQETDVFDDEYYGNQEMWNEVIVPEEVIYSEEVVTPEEIIYPEEVVTPEEIVYPEEQPEIVETPEAPSDNNSNNVLTPGVNLDFDTYLANQRVVEGLAPVQYSSLVQVAANIRAQELVSSYSHTRPNGTIFELLSQSNVSASSYGECIMKFSYSGNDVAEIDAITFDAWMNSPGHRAILMNGAYTNYGYSFVQQDSIVYAVYLAVG